MKFSLLSTKDAAERLGVTQRTIAHAINRGRLSGHKIGNMLAVVEDEKFRAFKPMPSRWDKAREPDKKTED